MPSRVEILFKRNLDNWNVSLRVHNHQRYKNSMIIPSLSLSLEVESLTRNNINHPFSQFLCTASIVVEFVGFWWETIVVKKQSRPILVENGELFLLPVSWDYHNSGWLWISIMNHPKMIVESSMTLWIKYWNRPSSMCDIGWWHLSLLFYLNFLVLHLKFNKFDKVLNPF